VRRKVKTVSVTGGQQLAARGFELLPAEVQFGTLKEGCSYSVPVLMKNVGFHTCRSDQYGCLWTCLSKMVVQ
jgi:hypothetical protein